MSPPPAAVVNSLEDLVQDLSDQLHALNEVHRVGEFFEMLVDPVLPAGTPVLEIERSQVGATLRLVNEKARVRLEEARETVRAMAECVEVLKERR